MKYLYIIISVILIIMAFLSVINFLSKNIRAKTKIKDIEINNLQAEEMVDKIQLRWQLTYPQAEKGEGPKKEKTDAKDEQIKDKLKEGRIEVWGKYFNEKDFKLLMTLRGDSSMTEIPSDPLCEIFFKVKFIPIKGNPSEKEITATARHKNVVADEFQGRKMLIYLPDGYYDSNKQNEKYPVIYMHDGQNLFSDRLSYAGEWHADEVADKLYKEGNMEPVIIVGIYNSPERLDEYSPYRQADIGGGKAKEYCEFLTEQLMPYVETKYRIKRNQQDRAVIGSSMGGLLAMWTIMNYPHQFCMAGVMSPSFWVAQGSILKDIENNPKHKNIKIWIDQGTNEWQDTTRTAIGLLVEKGYKYGEELAYYEVKDGNHNEKDWSQRLASPFIMFKGRQAKEITHIKADIEFINKEKGHYREKISSSPEENLHFIINPVAQWDNGMTYSLFHTAQYQIIKNNRIGIDDKGVITLDLELLIKYPGGEKKVLLRSKPF